MAQLSLFESSESVLADDEWGRITYAPHFVAAPVAQAWFAELRDAVSWKAERRRMYDRDVDVPRLTAHFHLAAEGPEASPAPAVLLQGARRAACIADGRAAADGPPAIDDDTDHEGSAPCPT